MGKKISCDILMAPSIEIHYDAKRLMDSVRQKMSPLSWWIFYAGYLPLFFSVFHLNLSQLAVILLVDVIALQILIAWERRYLVRTFPSLLAYDLENIEPKLAKMSENEVVALLLKLMKFPQHFSRYLFISSYIKAIPAAALLIFWVPHPGPAWIYALYFLPISLVAYSYFYVISFLESHIYLSRKISSFHEQYDWTNVFNRLSLPTTERQFGANEKFALIVFSCSGFLLQYLLVANEPASRERLELQLFFLGSIIVLLGARMWFLGRKYITSGLEEVFSRIDAFDPVRAQKALPLHTSPLLAKYEQTFNNLVERLQNHEREISRWVFSYAELHRYGAIGELSSLIVHDLVGPLNTTRYCSEQLAENPALIHEGKYLERLQQSLEKSIKLIDSLRAFLRPRESRRLSANVYTSFLEVKEIVSIQFFENDFQNFFVYCDPALTRLNVRIPDSELVHILLNLCTNSVKNLVTHAVSSPSISLRLHSQTPEMVTLEITDNGTGLTPEDFERLTAFAYLSVETCDEAPKTGLGLRLTRRLIERYGGNLSVKPGNPGTVFQITLPRAPIQTDEAFDGAADQTAMDERHSTSLLSRGISPEVGKASDRQGLRPPVPLN